MKVTHVGIKPTPTDQGVERPALTPELLAAVGARYSRNDEGLESILATIDENDHDASLERIFKFLDYGHASIADMSPVALFMDGISIYLAYLLWAQCPTAGGQESSTRYIKMSREGIVDPEILGIPEKEREAFLEHVDTAFSAYETALSFWGKVATIDPERIRIPGGTNDKAAARMRRNFAFDRARYFLPVCAKTNVMMVQSARAWNTLCQFLLSHYLPEAIALGEQIKKELDIAVPHLSKHARFDTSTQMQLQYDWDFQVKTANLRQRIPLTAIAPCKSEMQFFSPYETTRHFLQDMMISSGLKLREHRYSPCVDALRRLFVRFSLEGIALAELRDLNRHRTGEKYMNIVPLGFYGAADQIIDSPVEDTSLQVGITFGLRASTLTRTRLSEGYPHSAYYSLLGTTYYFEHTCAASKFIYEAELRTGTGAHFRYRRHMEELLALWETTFPGTGQFIHEGRGEPE